MAKKIVVTTMCKESDTEKQKKAYNIKIAKAIAMSKPKGIAYVSEQLSAVNIT